MAQLPAYAGHAGQVVIRYRDRDGQPGRMPLPLKSWSQSHAGGRISVVVPTPKLNYGSRALYDLHARGERVEVTLEMEGAYPSRYHAYVISVRPSDSYDRYEIHFDIIGEAPHTYRSENHHMNNDSFQKYQFHSDYQKANTTVQNNVFSIENLRAVLEARYKTNTLELAEKRKEAEESLTEADLVTFILEDSDALSKDEKDAIRDYQVARDTTRSENKTIERILARLDLLAGDEYTDDGSVARLLNLSLN